MSSSAISEPDSRREIPQLADLPEISLQDQVERCAFYCGTQPDSYLVTEPEYEHFWNADRSGLVGYIRDGKYLHVIGGLIAPPQHREELLVQFCEYADENQLLIAFYSIEEEDLTLFRQYGFQVTKFGENTSIDLRNHHWTGRQFAWVRRQTSYVARQGIAAREIILADMTPLQRAEVFERLHAINREHLADRVMAHDIGLLEGKLHKDHFYRRRLFVAYDRSRPDHWEAYVVCTPMDGGLGWATEMYRNTKQSTRGVIPFLLVYVIDTMKNEGLNHISLCMVPAYNCHSPLEGDSWHVRVGLTIWANWLGIFFNVKGLYHFKARFRPQFSPVYVCVRDRATLLSTLSFVRCTGFFNMSCRNLFRKLLGRFGRKR